MLFAVLTHAYRIVDQYWIQGVSTEAQAAIGASFFVLIMYYAAFEVVAAGAGPLIARATGARDAEARRRILGTSIGAALVAGLGVSLVGGFGAEALTAALGLTGETAAQCATYIRVLSVTILPLALTPLVDQVFIAMGDTRSPMALQGLSLGLNFALTPLLIFGFGSFGGWGIAGAALASNGSRLVSTGIGLEIIRRRTRLRTRDLKVNGDLVRILKLGAPMAVGTMTYAGVYWGLLFTVIAPLGPSVIAALSIGFSALESVTWPAFHGVSLAVASVVGRSLGAGRPDEARAAVRMALPLITALGAIATLAFWLAGEWLTGLFTEDPAVHREATLYATVLAASQMAVAWESLCEGALAGAGDTRTVFWLGAPLNALRIPMAWVAVTWLGMGAAGVWWTINVSTWLKALLKGIAVRRGDWSRLEI
jgi:MATE family multidrug resistance protein